MGSGSKGWRSERRENGGKLTVTMDPEGKVKPVEMKNLRRRTRKTKVATTRPKFPTKVATPLKRT